MATQAEIAILTSRLNGTDGFDEGAYETLIDRFASQEDGDQLYLATAEAWTIRAGRYHALVDTSESGSSRAMGDLYKNAIAMAAFYRKLWSDDHPAVTDPGVVASGRTRTGRIVRA